MKTKTIPFDLETAKKIQAGEIKGKIKTRGGDNVRIVGFNRKNELSIIALVGIYENVISYCANGNFFNKDAKSGLDIMLEVPDNEPQFKPFDKVLVRNENDQVWRANIFSHILNGSPFPYTCVTSTFKQCIPYEGNQDLVGTTKTPKNYGDE